MSLFIQKTHNSNTVLNAARWQRILLATKGATVYSPFIYPENWCSPILHYYLLTPCCRVLLEKLTGLQLVKKFPAHHGTRRFITAFTTVRHLSLSWARPIQSIYPHPTSWRSILILSTYLRLGLPSGLLPSGFPTKTLYTPLSSPIRATCPAHLIYLLNYLSNVSAIICELQKSKAYSYTLFRKNKIFTCTVPPWSFFFFFTVANRQLATNPTCFVILSHSHCVWQSLKFVPCACRSLVLYNWNRQLIKHNGSICSVLRWER